MKETRQQDIIDLLKSNKEISTEDLANHFGVSTQTIRRDLDKLEQDGLVVKMYGGATLVGGPVEEDPDTLNLMPFSQQSEERDRIAETALRLIDDGSTIVLDTGGTVRALAKLLNTKNHLTVITRDVLTAATLMKNPTNNIYLIGGFINKWYEASGQFATDFLKTVSRIDAFIFGTGGVTLNEGFTSTLPGTEDFRSILIPMAQTVIVLADHTKFGKTCFYRTCDITDVDYIITGKAADTKLVEEIQNLGVNITTA